MKNQLKKLFYLFIATTLLISCSSNDNNTLLDPIIGKWQLTSFTFNGTEESTECSKKSTITFFQNGTGSNDIFEFTSNSCMNFNENLTWINIGNNKYNIDNGNGVETFEFVFSNNNSVFKVTVTQIINGTTYTEVSTYKRI